MIIIIIILAWVLNEIVTESALFEGGDVYIIFIILLKKY